MNITTILAIYFIIWWITLFAVLPFGIKSQSESGAESGVEIEAGTDPGAPAMHVMWRKVMWTTLIATIIFGILYFCYTNDLLPIDFLKRIATPPHQ
jgi:predicted secreted protein